MHSVAPATCRGGLHTRAACLRCLHLVHLVLVQVHHLYSLQGAGASVHRARRRTAPQWARQPPHLLVAMHALQVVFTVQLAQLGQLGRALCTGEDGMKACGRRPCGIGFLPTLTMHSANPT